MKRDLTDLKKDGEELEIKIGDLIKEFRDKYQGNEFNVMVFMNWTPAGFNNDAHLDRLCVHVVNKM